VNAAGRDDADDASTRMPARQREHVPELLYRFAG
jgi:hypothetical protein